MKWWAEIDMGRYQRKPYQEANENNIKHNGGNSDEGRCTCEGCNGDNVQGGNGRFDSNLGDNG